MTQAERDRRDSLNNDLNNSTNGLYVQKKKKQDDLDWYYQDSNRKWQVLSSYQTWKVKKILPKIGTTLYADDIYSLRSASREQLFGGANTVVAGASALLAAAVVAWF